MSVAIEEAAAGGGERKTFETLSFIYDYYFLCDAIIIPDVQSFDND